MKTCRYDLFGFMLLILAYLSACNSTTALDVSPLWSEQDIKEAEKTANSMPGILVQRQVTVFMRPTFYTGSMPLEFISTGKELPGSMGFSSYSATFSHKFDKWENYFIYDKSNPLHSLPIGAIAVDTDSRKILAECKFIRFVKNEGSMSDLELEEVHYDQSGKYPIFTSTFTVNFGEGFKKTEINAHGRKIQDYFFLWPTGITG